MKPLQMSLYGLNKNAARVCLCDISVLRIADQKMQF